MRLLKLVPLIALILLAGCETLGLSSSAPAADTAAAPAPVVAVAEQCPLSAVLSEASKVTFLQGGDVAASADMSPPRLECDYEPSTRVDEIDLIFPLVVTKGPSATSDNVDLTYFIALMNLSGEVLAKRIYQRRISFDGKQSVIATESVENLLLTLGPGTKPTDHRILIGFQLTAEQLAYNRTRANVPPPTTPATGATTGAAPAPPAPATPAPAVTPAPTPPPGQ